MTSYFLGCDRRRLPVLWLVWKAGPLSIISWLARSDSQRRPIRICHTELRFGAAASLHIFAASIRLCLCLPTHTGPWILSQQRRLSASCHPSPFCFAVTQKVRCFTGSALPCWSLFFWPHSRASPQQVTCSSTRTRISKVKSGTTSSSWWSSSPHGEFRLSRIWLNGFFSAWWSLGLGLACMFCVGG